MTFSLVRHKLAALGCLLGAVAAACGVGGRRGDSESVIRVAYCCGEWAMTPNYNLAVRHLVFLPLNTFGDRGEVEGRLARSWEHSPDYRTWTIRLRTDVRWHDGVPVTAHDVKFTLDLLQDPGALWVPPGTYTVTVPDDSTVRITYHRGTAQPLDGYTVFFPKHLLEKLNPAEINTWEFWLRPVGNGPYRYVRHVPGTLMEFEANPDFYRGRPRIDRVALRFGEGALTDLLAGNVDVIPYLDRMDLLKLEGDPRFRVYDYAGPNVSTAIIWNHRRPLFLDARVRRAFSMAVDRRELHRLLNFPDRSPVFDVLFTWGQFRRGELPEPLVYDPEAARVLLDAAGWRDSDGDGVRDRDGEPLRFSLLVPVIRERERVAVYVQEQLRRIGVAVEVRTMELESGRERMQSGDFDAAIERVASTVGGRSGHDRTFGKDSYTGYRNSRVAELLVEAATTVSPEERDRLYRELVPIFQRELPVLFLYPYIETTVAHRRVRGLRDQVRVDPVSHMEELWLDVVR